MRKFSYNQVIEGNIELHRKEARFYDCVHQEIWNRTEQKRLWSRLNSIVSLIDGNSFRALDFGAGTGNVTEKLLALGFEVLAIDISREMCMILKEKCRKAFDEGKLLILNTNFDKIEMSERYDVVACFSVLHHLPDYIRTVKKLAGLVKEGGIFYIDHEPASTYQNRRRHDLFKRLILATYYVTRNIFQDLYLHGFKAPHLDYTRSDVHTELDCRHVLETLREKGFEIVRFENYYCQETWFKTPLNILHQVITGPNSIVIIAKKRVYF